MTLSFDAEFIATESASMAAKVVSEALAPAAVMALLKKQVLTPGELKEAILEVSDLALGLVPDKLAGEAEAAFGEDLVAATRLEVRKQLDAMWPGSA